MVAGDIFRKEDREAPECRCIGLMSDVMTMLIPSRLYAPLNVGMRGSVVGRAPGCFRVVGL